MNLLIYAWLEFVISGIYLGLFFKEKHYMYLTVVILGLCFGMVIIKRHLGY